MPGNFLQDAAGFFQTASPIIAGATGVANIGGTLGNFGLQLNNLKYQKDLQKTLFAREDNAVQRRVRDLEAAGLSPVLAAGSAAQAGPVVSTVAPQLGRLDDVGSGAIDRIATDAAIQQSHASAAASYSQGQLLQRQREKTEYETEIAKANLDAITKGIKMREKAGLMPDITSGLGVELENSGSLWKETIDSITKGDFKQAAPALLGLVLKMGVR